MFRSQARRLVFCLVLAVVWKLGGRKDLPKSPKEIVQIVLGNAARREILLSDCGRT